MTFEIDEVERAVLELALRVALGKFEQDVAAVRRMGPSARPGAAEEFEALARTCRLLQARVAAAADITVAIVRGSGLALGEVVTTVWVSAEDIREIRMSDATRVTWTDAEITCELFEQRCESALANAGWSRAETEAAQLERRQFVYPRVR